jgi:hypothetical protein
LHQETVDPMEGIVLPHCERVAIANAALFAHAGRHAEAEVSRWSADYHNLDTRPDADVA